MSNPPDFYQDPDPNHPAMLRWWNGTEWGEERVVHVVVQDLEHLVKDVRFLTGVVKFLVALWVIGFLLVVLALSGS